ncbi:MAG TPA: SDR family NAD(P)-dependent oxidoreductase [Caulobacteraceae bacterium]|nr:SDR family NAD(P)-dependent oxidoreductase [Caulobacteraceae bacterium]
MPDASTHSQPLAGRIALVTGATRGIGRAGAAALAGAGAHVIVVGRTQGALEELDDEITAAGGHRPTLVPLDLTEGDGIDALGLEIYQRHKRLDVLVHAAGMLGGLWPVAHVDPRLWDKIIATNLTAAYRLIRSFEPLLRQSEAGRALFITSERATHPKAFWGTYAATKAALDAMVRCWADEIEHTKVRAVLVDPGPMRTRMRAEAFPGDDPETLPAPTEIGPMIVELAAAADLGLPMASVRFSEWKAAREAPAST